MAIFGRAGAGRRRSMNARTSAFSSSQLLISSPLPNSMYGLCRGVNTRGCAPSQPS
jgi:hypothetical protein